MGMEDYSDEEVPRKMEVDGEQKRKKNDKGPKQDKELEGEKEGKKSKKGKKRKEKMGE